MDVKPSRGLLRYFHHVPDPRAANVSFSLPSLLAMTLLAVLCRCDDYDEIACWCGERADWLATFLDLPEGEQGPRTPHADTFERVFRRIRPTALERAFIAFTEGLAEASAGRLVAIDGKTLRGSIDCGGRKAAIHMVHAWDQQNHLVLGQLAVEAKSNEITAVPKLLELLDVKGAVVSLDAMHCQKDTAAAIRKAGADYLLAVKQNQPSLHEDVKLFFDDAIEQHDAGLLHAVAEPDNARPTRRTPGVGQRQCRLAATPTRRLEAPARHRLRRRQTAGLQNRQADRRASLLPDQPRSTKSRPRAAARARPRPLGRGESTALVPGRVLRRQRQPRPQRPWPAKPRRHSPPGAQPASQKPPATRPLRQPIG